jgi:hypothetical protein
VAGNAARVGYANSISPPMAQTNLSALAPIVFTLLLGFVAAWRRDFGPKEASVLNHMVLLYAVPLAWEHLMLL